RLSASYSPLPWRERGANQTASTGPCIRALSSFFPLLVDDDRYDSSAERLQLPDVAAIQRVATERGHVAGRIDRSGAEQAVATAGGRRGAVGVRLDHADVARRAPEQDGGRFGD